MLGRSEKSSLRRRLGAALVAVGTVITLPLTATVTYAESVDPADLSAPQAPLAPAPPSAPLAPLAPLAPTTPVVDGDEINITMLNGRKNADLSKDHVHKIKFNGRTIVLRTDKELSEKEVRKMVEEAEKSRMEADKALRESGMDRKHISSTMREVEREIAQVKREMQQQLRDADQEVRDALQEARDARQEAWEAEREARNSSKSTARISSISYATSTKVSGPDCIAMNRQIAMGGKNGLTGQAWAVVAGCGGFEVKIDKAAILDAALQGLKKERAEAEKCKDSKPDHARKIKDIDSSIEKVKAQLSMT